MILPDGLFQPPFAHRGLWRPGGPPENSLSAFAAACTAGYGIEFDVRLSADGEPVVFHDTTLDRLTGEPGFVWDLSASELAAVPLLGGPDRIPTLAKTLELVAGRAMLLIEVKAQPGAEALASHVASLLDHYDGPCCIISFEAEILAWFAWNRPGLLRGLDAEWLSDDKVTESQGHITAAFAEQFDMARPHVLVLEAESALGSLAAGYRAEGAPVIAWTVRSPDQAARLAGRCDNFIFEGFAA